MPLQLLFVKSNMKNKFQKIILTILAINFISICWNEAYIMYGFPKNIFLRSIPAIINPFLILMKSFDVHAASFLDFFNIYFVVFAHSAVYLAITYFLFTAKCKIIRILAYPLLLLYLTPIYIILLNIFR